MLELLAEDEFRDGPVGRARAAGLPARLARASSSGSSTGRAAHARARRRSWSGSSRAPTGTTRSSRRASTAGTPPVFEDKADCDRNFEALTRAPARGAAGSCASAIASHNLRSVAHAIACNRAAGRRRTRDLELQVLRGLGDDLAAGARRAAACACAPTARSATSWPGWPTSCAGCSRTRATSRSCTSRRAGADARGAARRAVRLPPSRTSRSLELRRAAGARRAARRRCASSTRRLPLRVPVLDRRTTRRPATGSISTDPGTPDAGRRRSARRATEADVAAAVEAAARGRRDWARAARGRARRGPRRRRRAAARAAARAGRARRCASARSRGPRPTPTSARRSTSSSTTRARRVALERGRAAAPGARRAQHDALRARAAWCAVISPWNFPLAIPTGHGRRPRWPPATRSCSSRPSSRPACGAGARARRCARPACRPTRSRCCPARATPAPRSCGDPRRAHDRLHRLERRSGSRSCATAAETPAGQRPRQARRRRDGRQELRDRRLRRRPRRGRSRRSCSRRSSTPARSARRPRACSSTRRSPTRCSSGSPARSRCCRSARRTTSRTDVPPVIEREAQERVRALRARARERRGGSPRERGGRSPTRAGSARRRVAADLPADSPVLRRGDLRPAARRRARRRASRRRATCVDALPFALTGGLFSPQPRDRRVRRRARTPVGNLYVNRPITGAMVGAPAVRRQPPVGHRLEGRRPRLPAAVRRAARGDREHDAPRARGRIADRCFARPKEYPPRARTGCPPSHGTQPSAHPDGSLNRRGPGRAEARREDRAL